MATISIRFAESDDDIMNCLPVLRELRPQLIQETFLATIRQMKIGGYFLVMMEVNQKVVATAGYRFSEHLARGKFLYVDDFVTAQVQRRNGCGQNLFAWLLKQADDAGCGSMHLDSGVQRTKAHLFYEKQKMIFSSKHYSITIKPV